MDVHLFVVVLYINIAPLLSVVVSISPIAARELIDGGLDKELLVIIVVPPVLVVAVITDWFGSSTTAIISAMIISV